MENGIETKFRREIYTAEDGYTMPYRLYIPEDYDCGERYPLVLFLHGAGERGDDNEAQIRVGLPYLFSWDESPAYRAVIVAPQCPADKQWVDVPFEAGSFDRRQVKETRELKTALAILGEVMDFCNVDEDRIYVTGLSMGGYGTFDMLVRHGSRFAAGVPVCGGCDPEDARRLLHIPMWLFHGSMDSAVPPVGSRIYYAMARKAGGTKIRYTEYSGMGHGIWNNAYSDREMVEWMFSQSRYERRMLAEKKAKQKKTAAIIAGGVGAAAVAAVITGQVVKKRKAASVVELAPMVRLQEPAAVPQTTVTVEKTTVETAPVPAAEPVSVPAVQTEVQTAQPVKPIRPIKKIKPPKESKTKAMLHKAAGKTVDMTVQVIRRLSGI